MIRPSYTVLLIVLAIVVAFFKAGYCPEPLENGLIESRSGRVYSLLADARKMHAELDAWAAWKNNPWAAEVAAISTEVRRFDVALEDSYRRWKETGDERWVQASEQRVRALRAQIGAGRREAAAHSR